MKKQRGITLIALVITIIVMLILAGVTINAVVGENGVLGRAQNAVEATKLGSAKEQVSLAWTSCETDYLSEGMGKDKSTYFTASKLTSNLSQGEITEVSFGINVAGDSELSYKVTENGVDTYYKMQIAGGMVSIIGEPTTSAPTLAPPIPTIVPTEPFSSQITEEDYGDYVNYNKDLKLTLKLEGDETTPITDWRIFYEDTEQDRVYLIAADYVPNTSSLLKLSAAGMSRKGNYALYWENMPSALSEVARKDSIFGINANSYELNASNANSTCVSNLLDTDHWSNFVDTTVADYAIGGPTIEMYANSWNRKGYGTLTPASENTALGYTINGSNYVVMSSDSGYGDNLYYPHKTSNGIGSENCSTYWLAAPSASQYILCVRGDGDISYHGSTHIYVAVRPVVALKPGVKALKENGVWYIAK